MIQGGNNNYHLSVLLSLASRYICVPYSTKRIGSNLIPDFGQAETVEATTFCGPKNSDGSIDCKIDSTDFSLSQCYPEKHFCIHQVVCPLTHMAIWHHFSAPVLIYQNLIVMVRRIHTLC